MARRWTTEEENFYRRQLVDLYVKQNKTIAETGALLGLNDKTIFDRLRRLSIPTNRQGKSRFNNQRNDIVLPEFSEKLAEFFGIMLGDGHISHFQAVVTLGTKEVEYVQYVANLMYELFHAKPTILERKDGYRDIYIGSVALVKWLGTNGLVGNKVTAQVDIPWWIRENVAWKEHFIRGFFDTDGSIYRLKFGRQVSFCNHSMPLLRSLRELLLELEYNPSVVSVSNLYLTRRNDIDRFFREIRPANAKHLRRYQEFSNA